MTREECYQHFGKHGREAWTIAARAGVPKHLLSLTCDWYSGKISDDDKRDYWPQRLREMPITFDLQHLGEFQDALKKEAP